MLIKDGNSGRSARVNDDGQIVARSISHTPIGYNSLIEETAFILSLGSVIYTIGTDGGRILWLRSDSAEKILVINQFFVTWNGGSTNFNRTLQATLYLGDGVPSAGQVQSALGNLYGGSVEPLLGTVYLWDGSTGTGMTVAAGTAVATLQCGVGMTNLATEGSLALPYGRSLSINLKAVEAGTATVFVTGYFFDKNHIPHQ